MTAKITPWAFVLAVPDLKRSAAYFRDVLGFQLMWADAPDWQLAERDGVRVMMGHCPTDIPPADLGSHSWFGYLNADDVDALRAEFTGRGAVCSEPKNQPHGMREIIVTTMDGHRIVFGQPL